jgi:hypothetical protein
MASDNARSSSTKKTSTKQQSSAKKQPTKRASAKKSSGSSDNGSSRPSAARAESRPAARATQVAAQAASDLLELTGKGAEGVTGLERTDDGWTVQVEVVEMRRIPDTTDVLALYEVNTDKQGNLTGYRRVRRYARGVPGED